jgi:hypothetical protein
MAELFYSTSQAQWKNQRSCLSQHSWLRRTQFAPPRPFVVRSPQFLYLMEAAAIRSRLARLPVNSVFFPSFSQAFQRLNLENVAFSRVFFMRRIYRAVE